MIVAEPQMCNSLSSRAGSDDDDAHRIQNVPRITISWKERRMSRQNAQRWGCVRKICVIDPSLVSRALVGSSTDTTQADVGGVSSAIPYVPIHLFSIIIPLYCSSTALPVLSIFQIHVIAALSQPRPNNLSTSCALLAKYTSLELCISLIPYMVLVMISQS